MSGPYDLAEGFDFQSNNVAVVAHAQISVFSAGSLKVRN